MFLVAERKYLFALSFLIDLSAKFLSTNTQNTPLLVSWQFQLQKTKATQFEMPFKCSEVSHPEFQGSKEGNCCISPSEFVCSFYASPETFSSTSISEEMNRPCPGVQRGLHTGRILGNNSIVWIIKAGVYFVTLPNSRKSVYGMDRLATPRRRCSPAWALSKATWRWHKRKKRTDNIQLGVIRSY